MDEAPRRIGLDDLALDRLAPVGVAIHHRRAGLPVGFDAVAVVVLLGELGIREGLPDPLGRGTDVDLVDVLGCGHRSRCLQVMLDVGHLVHQRLGVAADPSVGDEPDGDRVEEVELPPAVPARGDEVRILEHAKVLHDAEAGHLRERRLQLAERLAIALPEPVEQHAPVRVGERPECRCQVLHAGNFM